LNRSQQQRYAPFKVSFLMTISLLHALIIFSCCFLFQSYSVASLTTNSIQISMSSESNEKSSFKVLGVCGGIGSGKSSASKLLVSDLGCLAHLGKKEVNSRRPYSSFKSVNVTCTVHTLIQLFTLYHQSYRCRHDRSHDL
jgi:hypothetical protein